MKERRTLLDLTPFHEENDLTSFPPVNLKKRKKKKEKQKQEQKQNASKTPPVLQKVGEIRLIRSRNHFEKSVKMKPNAGVRFLVDAN
jgi:hypothetical protein